MPGEASPLLESFLCAASFRVRLFVFDRLGRPKSSPSSSSYPIMSSSSSAFQSSFVFERKFMYVLNGGDDRPELFRGAGEVSDVRAFVELADGGVLGREDEELDKFLALRQLGAWRTEERVRGAHSESNLSMSACEYAAPLTRLESRPVFLDPWSRGGGFQNGEVELSPGQRGLAG